MSINAEMAVMSLYENESLTDHLTDKPAMTLLKWCEAQVMRLVNTHSDEAIFDEAFVRLRRLTRAMNTLAGIGDMMDVTKQKIYATEICDLATQLGFTVTEEQTNAYLARLTEIESDDRIRELIETIDPPQQTDLFI